MSDESISIAEAQALSAPTSDLERACDQLDRRLARDDLELPLRPRVAAAILPMAADDACDAAALARLVQQDQALAAHVMRIANSSAYRTRVPMVSLQQAIARLGMRSIREIETPSRMCGQSIMKPLLKVNFKTENGEDDAVGWYVKELDRWVSEINKRKGQG